MIPYKLSYEDELIVTRLELSLGDSRKDLNIIIYIKNNDYRQSILLHYMVNNNYEGYVRYLESNRDIEKYYTFTNYLNWLLIEIRLKSA